jgi:N-acetyl sugar amidotransferase
MEDNYEQCSACVMDITDPQIIFDENGICNHCKRYAQRMKNDLHTDEKGQVLLEKLILKIKKKNKTKEYDCVVGVSGGVDSTMVAYLAKRKFGLRPLAVHLDNGWNSELAVNNIEKTLKVLGIDLYTHVLNWDEFKSLQLSFLKSSFINAEIPTDHAITALLFQIAAKNGIRYILGGSNIATEGVLPFNWVYDHRDWRLIKSIHKRFERKNLRNYPHYTLSLMFYYIFIKRIKYISLLNFVEYNKNEAIKNISEELGWEYYGGKHYESIYTRFYQGYILPTKYNVDKRKSHLSSLIRSGQMSREEALEELKQPPYPKDLAEEDKLYVAKKFGLTETEFDKLMDLPIKSFKEYPNNHFLFTRFSFLVNLSKKLATCSGT